VILNMFHPVFYYGFKSVNIFTFEFTVSVDLIGFIDVNKMAKTYVYY